MGHGGEKPSCPGDFEEREPTDSPADEVSLGPVHGPFAPRRPLPSSPCLSPSQPHLG